MKKTYFIADAHLGSHFLTNGFKNEYALVRWLDAIKEEAGAIYFLGDMLDFWFEYRRVVPKGFVRFLGKVAELVDRGVEIHYFAGNHDLWIKDYLPTELGIILHREPLFCEIKGKKFLIAHGDEFLTKQDRRYRLLRAIFHNHVLQWLFSWIHPDISVGFAFWWSRHNRGKHLKRSVPPELQLLPYEDFVRNYRQNASVDYFVFAHLHFPYIEEIEGSKMIVLGDCMEGMCYGEFDGKEFYLKK